jgi:DNA-binding transcriptional LysR family regulator
MPRTRVFAAVISIGGNGQAYFMNEQRLAWADIRVVLAVARAGSLLGAAARLGTSHPTVFRRIRRIEAALGTRLFERSRAGYAATPAGDEIAALAGRMEDDVAALERRLLGRDLRPSGTVRITTTDTIMSSFLAPLLKRLRARHPEIVLEIVVANQFFSLSKRDADVALRPSRDAPENLVGRRIGDIATAVYRARTLAAPAPDDWGRADWLVPDDSLSELPSAKWLAARGLDRRAALRANSLVTLRDAAGAGAGLAVLPCYLGDPAGLARVGAPIPELASALWLLTHPDLRATPRIRAVLDGLAEFLRPLRPLLAGRRRR